MTKVLIPIKVSPTFSESNLGDLTKIEVERRFGRTPFYLCVDLTTDQHTLVPNTNHHFGGKDSPPDIAKKQECDAVIALHMGSKPYLKFQEYGIKVYLGNEGSTVAENINLLREEKLSIFTEPPPGSCCGGGSHRH